MIEVSNNTIAKLFKGTMLEIHVLKLLDEKPIHGYAIITAIKKRFGVYLGPSTIYPLLVKLNHDGCITSEWNMNAKRPKKVYTLTPKGKAFLETSQIDLKLAVQTLLLTAQ